jgi:hypothetical protein
MGVMALFLGVFYCFTKDRPEDVGLKPYIDNNKAFNETEHYLYREVFEKKKSPLKYFFTRKKFLWWCAIAMLSSLCRYGLLKWIPLYYSVKEGGRHIEPEFFEPYPAAGNGLWHIDTDMDQREAVLRQQRHHDHCERRVVRDFGHYLSDDGLHQSGAHRYFLHGLFPVRH